MNEQAFKPYLDVIHELVRDHAPELVEQATSMVLSLVIKDTEKHYGVCEQCSHPRALFNAQYLITDASNRFHEYTCSSCIANNVVWDINRSLGLNRYDSPTANLVNMDSILPEYEPRPTCPACGDKVLQEGDYGIGYRPHRSCDAIGSDGNTYTVHNSCARLCSLPNGCGQVYVGEVYSNVRNPNVRSDIGNRFYSVLHSDTCSFCYERVHLEMNLEYCESCNNYEEPNNFVFSSNRDTEICNRCYRNNYVECSNCGRDYIEARNHECYREDDEDENSLYCYSYKPDPRFFGTAPYHLGIELEVECGRGVRNPTISEGVEEVYGCLGRNRTYLKSDGSLNNGFEIVTHPHSLDEYHKLDWSFLDNLKSQNFRSWNTETCGLHVHISRTAYTNKSHMLRFIKFIYDNKKQVQLLSGRSSDWARFNDKGRLIHKISDSGYFVGDGHYSAVNTENSETLEVRVFRGSLRKERVLSAIEFVHCSTEYTRNMKVVPKDRPMAWTRFCSYLVDKTDQYPNLFTIMEETYAMGREINESDGE
jgi:hypothetical protein